MADFQLRVPPSQISLFVGFIALDETLLGKIADDMLNMGRFPTIEAFNESLKEKGHPGEASETVSSVVYALASIKYRTNRSTDDILTRIGRDLESKGIGDWEQSRWDSKLDILKKLVATETAVALLAKAGVLNSEGIGMVLDVRILTDTRWVFSESAESVLGALTRHLLNLVCMDSRGNDVTTSFVLDDSDLETLKDQIERSLNKSKTIASLTETTQTTTFKV